MLKRRFHEFSLLLLLFLAACSSAGGDSPADEILRIAISPAAQPASMAVLSCASSFKAVEQQILIEMYRPEGQELAQFDFAIQLGEVANPPEIVAPLAEEELVVILHPSNPLRRLSAEQIADLFSGRIRNWDILDGNDVEVALWIGPPGDEARLALESDLLVGSPVSGSASLAASPQLMLDAVGADANAIGLLPAAWVNSSVKRLDSGISLPVLALAEGALSPEARAILACLQGEQGLSILAETYAP